MSTRRYEICFHPQPHQPTLYCPNVKSYRENLYSFKLEVYFAESPELSARPFLLKYHRPLIAYFVTLITFRHHKGVVGHCRCYIHREIYYRPVSKLSFCRKYENTNFSYCSAVSIYIISTKFLLLQGFHQSMNDEQPRCLSVCRT